MNKVSQVKWQEVLKDNSLKNRLIRAVMGSFGLGITATGLSFLGNVILARLLNVEGFGIYAYALAWMGLLSLPATLGLDKLLMREVAVYQAQSAWGLLKGIVGWANLTVFCGSTVVAIIAILITYSTAPNPTLFWAMFIALIALPINSLTNLRQSTMKGLQKIVLGNLPESLIAPSLFLIAVIIAYLLLGNNFNVLWVLVLKIAVSLLTFLVGAILLARVLPAPVEKVAPEYQRKKWLLSALPFMFLEAIQLVNFRTDILMLGALKNPAEVGVYVVVTRGAELVLFAQTVVNSSMAPNIASLYAEGNLIKLQKMVAKGTQFNFLASALGGGILILFGYWFLLMFGAEFTRGQTALTILIISQIINAASGPAGWLLVMTGYEKYSTMTFGFSALLNVVLNALLIPQFGIEGAAIATAISLISVNLINVILVKQKIKISSTILGI